MIAVVIALVVVVAVLGFRLWLDSRSGLIHERRRRRVLVTLKTGEAFAGVLLESDRESLVLVEATAVAFGARSQDEPVAGEVLVLRADVAYLQLP